MRSYAIALVFSALLTTVQSASAQPTPAYEFNVVFDGIIMHYFPNSPLLTNARSLVIEGNAMTLRHKPTLITPADIDVAALRDATGQPVFCDATYCRVKIDGFDIRIGTDDEKSPAPGPLQIDKSFSDYAPNMQRVTGGNIIVPAGNTFPASPIAGFFELTGGKLTASKFKADASFDPDYDHEKDRPFADKVFLDGSVDVKSTACLQILSVYTWPSWKVIKHAKAEELKITVENHGTHRMGDGSPVPSTLHFALNKKVVITALAFPHVCPSNGVGDDPACQGKLVPVTSLNMEEAIAGCANTQWP